MYHATGGMSPDTRRADVDQCGTFGAAGRSCPEYERIRCAARRSRSGTGARGRPRARAGSRRSRHHRCQAKPGMGRRHEDADRQCGDSLPRLRHTRRQGRLQPRYYGAGGRRPSAIERRPQRRADQRHARRHAAEHAHRPLLQRQRLAGRAPGRQPHGLFHHQPAAFFRPRAAANRREQLPDGRRLDHQLPAAAPRLAHRLPLHPTTRQQRLDHACIL